MPRKLGFWTWTAIGLAVAGVAIVLLRGGTAPVTRAGLADAQARWQRAGIRSYDLDLETSGAQTGQYHVEVRGGKLERITRNGQPADPAAGEYWTVPGLFRTIEEELDNAEHPSAAFPGNAQVWLHAHYDPHLGFPVRFIRQVPGTALGVEIHVRRFSPVAAAGLSSAAGS